MQFTEFARRPFVIEAVQITADNIHDVCALIGHEVLEEDGRKFIVVNKRIVPQGRRAQIGWWVTRRDEEYRTYSEGSFNNQFITKGKVDVLEALALFEAHAPVRINSPVANPEATAHLVEMTLDPTMSPEPGGPGSIEVVGEIDQIPLSEVEILSSSTVPDVAGGDIVITGPHDPELDNSAGGEA